MDDPDNCVITDGTTRKNGGGPQGEEATKYRTLDGWLRAGYPTNKLRLFLCSLEAALVAL